MNEAADHDLAYWKALAHQNHMRIIELQERLNIVNNKRYDARRRLIEIAAEATEAADACRSL